MTILKNGIDTRNLGYQVTTRFISIEQLAREAEGSRWNLPFKTYDMGDGIIFVTYNFAIDGKN